MSLVLDPLTEKVDIEELLSGGGIDEVICAGDSGENPRECNLLWVKELRRQCVRHGVSFTFKRTGSLFVKDGKTYRIPLHLQEEQALKSGYNYIPGRNMGEKISYSFPDRGYLRERLSESKFRSRFKLDKSDIEYIKKKGLETIRFHARDFTEDRLSAENPANDGSQTPMRGHPVFKAMHATACCCRGCIEKWHHIPAGKVLNDAEKEYITEIIMEWVVEKYGKACDIMDIEGRV